MNALEELVDYIGKQITRDTTLSELDNLLSKCIECFPQYIEYDPFTGGCIETVLSRKVAGHPVSSSFNFLDEIGKEGFSITGRIIAVENEGLLIDIIKQNRQVNFWYVHISKVCFRLYDYTKNDSFTWMIIDWMFQDIMDHPGHFTKRGAKIQIDIELFESIFQLSMEDIKRLTHIETIYGILLKSVNRKIMNDIKILNETLETFEELKTIFQKWIEDQDNNSYYLSMPEFIESKEQFFHWMGSNLPSVHLYSDLYLLLSEEKKQKIEEYLLCDESIDVILYHHSPLHNNN